MAFKTYKIDLSEDQIAFLQKNKTKSGIAISWQLTEAVKNYIKQKKAEQDGNI